jgi:hypothetical protein
MLVKDSITRKIKKGNFSITNIVLISYDINNKVEMTAPSHLLFLHFIDPKISLFWFNYNPPILKIGFKALAIACRFNSMFELKGVL